MADLLAEGERCEAAHEADRLLNGAIEAVNSGAVPARLQDELIATANELVNEINCPPPPQAVVEEDEDREGNGNKGKGKGKKGDED